MTADVVGVDSLTADVAMVSDVASDGASCAVTDAGALQTNYYCDLAVIHVLQHTGASASVIVQARLGTGPDTCGAIDSVDVVRGTTMLAHLGPTASVTLGSQNAEIATGNAPTALVGECANETTRLSAYGLVIRGRDSHGPFEARCGTADSGSRWPPGTSLACHQNIDRPAVGPGMIMVSTSAGGSATQFTLNLPHADGQPAATSVDTTVRVVSPERYVIDPGPPLASHDTTGWMGTVSEDSSPVLGASTTIGLNTFGATPIFDTQLCPPPGTPGPGYVPPPWFLARVTGQGPTGAYTAEILTSCVTISM